MLTRREHALYIVACLLFVVLTGVVFSAIGELVAGELAR